MVHEPMSAERLAEIRTLIGHQRQYVAGMMQPPHEIDVLAAMEDLLAEAKWLREQNTMLVELYFPGLATSEKRSADDNE